MPTTNDEEEEEDDDDVDDDVDGDAGDANDGGRRNGDDGSKNGPGNCRVSIHANSVDTSLDSSRLPLDTWPAPHGNCRVRIAKQPQTKIIIIRTVS